MSSTIIIYLVICLSNVFVAAGFRPTRLTINLTRIDNLETYVNPVNIGYQNFGVLFDTNINKSWIISDKLDPNNGHNCGFGCSGPQYSDKINYKGVQLKGSVIRDDVLIKIKAYYDGGSLARNQKLEPNMLSVFEADLGRVRSKVVFGLAPGVDGEIKWSNIVEEFFGRLHQDSEDCIGFWLVPASGSDPSGGVMSIGDLDPALYDKSKKITYHSINAPNQWRIRMSKVELKTDRLDDKERAIELCPSGQCDAIIDSGVMSIYAPKKAVESISKTLNAVQEGDLWQVNCEIINQKKGFLYFKVDSEIYGMYPSQYIVTLEKDGRKICYLAIKESEGSDWVLGTRFMLGYYTVLDYFNKRIAFAHRI